MAGKLKNEKFFLYDENGSPIFCEGGYVIVDGGYKKVVCLMDPLHFRAGRFEVHWTKFLESVGEDAECTFGILKQRFRILHNGMVYHEKDFIERMVQCCCILHNMLLSYDGLDHFEWEKDINWKSMDPELQDISIMFPEAPRRNT